MAEVLNRKPTADDRRRLPHRNRINSTSNYTIWWDVIRNILTYWATAVAQKRW
ncbi:hypothetical protein ACWCQS_19525 [Streptomyces sp. NPDC002076]